MHQYSILYKVKLTPLLVWVTLLLMASISWAQIDTEHHFENSQDRIRYQQLLSELRCPKCQNQSLLGSDAGIAGDLRNKVFELMQQDMNNEEIKHYLQQRYGDFVLYEPPVKTSTLALWSMPFILILIIVMITFKFLRRNTNA